jgi:predicted nucleic acid-binding protein
MKRMSADAFFDSNILLYSVSSDSIKAARAMALINAGGVISVQVLNEFANVSRRKYDVSFDKVRKALAAFRELCAVRPLDVETHDAALDIAERYRFDMYDSLIVASALRAGCRTLYSEDLQHGQVVDGLTIRNPFIS